jgi:hypothetical protein
MPTSIPQLVGVMDGYFPPGQHSCDRIDGPLKGDRAKKGNQETNPKSIALNTNILVSARLRLGNPPKWLYSTPYLLVLAKSNQALVLRNVHFLLAQVHGAAES